MIPSANNNVNSNLNMKMRTMPAISTMPTVSSMPSIPSSPCDESSIITNISDINNSTTSSIFHNILNDEMGISNILNFTPSVSPIPIDALNVNFNLVPNPSNVNIVNIPTTPTSIQQSIQPSIQPQMTFANGLGAISAQIPAQNLVQNPNGAPPGFNFHHIPPQSTDNTNSTSSPPPISQQEGKGILLDIHYETKNFLTMYYDTLKRMKIKDIKKFYHQNAEIDRSCLFYGVHPEKAGRMSYDMSMDQKLDLLQDVVLSIDIESIITQKSLSNSMLVRVNGIMEYMDNINNVSTKLFQQIFFIMRDDQFWLIQNDILSFPSFQQSVCYKTKTNINTPRTQKQLYSDDSYLNSHSTASINSRKENFNVNINRPKMPKFETPQKLNQHNPSRPRNHNNCNYNRNDDRYSNDCNIVNSELMNKFYRDASYQNYDNNLAIFIRRIPKNITQQRLENILRSCLVKYCENNGINHCDNILIEYVDVNYQKQYAFVYLGNIETYTIALEMGHITIGWNTCQIEQKRSGNGPRKAKNITHTRNYIRS